jgi:hypothetical protein
MIATATATANATTALASTEPAATKTADTNAYPDARPRPGSRIRRRAGRTAFDDVIAARLAFRRSRIHPLGGRRVIHFPLQR